MLCVGRRNLHGLTPKHITAVTQICGECASMGDVLPNGCLFHAQLNCLYFLSTGTITHLIKCPQGANVKVCQIKGHQLLRHVA